MRQGDNNLTRDGLAVRVAEEEERVFSFDHVFGAWPHVVLQLSL